MSILQHGAVLVLFIMCAPSFLPHHTPTHTHTYTHTLRSPYRTRKKKRGRAGRGGGWWGSRGYFPGSSFSLPKARLYPPLPPLPHMTTGHFPLLSSSLSPFDAFSPSFISSSFASKFILLTPVTTPTPPTTTPYTHITGSLTPPIPSPYTHVTGFAGPPPPHAGGSAAAQPGTRRGSPGS